MPDERSPDRPVDPLAAAADTAATDGNATFEFLMRRMRTKSDFPALSSSIVRIQSLSRSDSETLGGLTEEILKDVALTQKLLRVVNSAYYRRGGAISTISRAVALIGFAGIRNLALSLLLVEHMDDKRHAQQLKESFLGAVMAGTLAAELSKTARDSEEAFIGALMRNLGRLLTEFYLPEDADQIRGLARGQGLDGKPVEPMDEQQASRKVLGLPFHELGVSVGRTWGLPDGLLRAMVPPEPPLPPHLSSAHPDHVGWLASAANEVSVAMMVSEPAALGARLEGISKQYAKPLGLKPDDINEAAARARKRLTEMTQALNLKLAPDSPAERLLESYYEDAPNKGTAVAGPTPEALGLATPDTASGELKDSVPVARDKSSLLTAGIQDVTATMVDNFKLNEVLRMILETMYRALDLRRVIFCLRDAKTDTLIGRFGMGEGADQLKSAFQIPLKPAGGAAPDLFAAVCIKGVDTLISDASAPSIVARLPVFFRDRVQAPTFLLLPLATRFQGQNKIIGLIYADSGTVGDIELSEQELSLLRTLRNQAVMAFRQVA